MINLTLKCFFSKRISFLFYNTIKMRINTNYFFLFVMFVFLFFQTSTFCFCWNQTPGLSPCYLQLCTHWSNRTIGSFTTYAHWGWEATSMCKGSPEHITLVMICWYLNHLNLRNHVKNMKRFWRAAEVGRFSHFSLKIKNKGVTLEDRLLKCPQRK